MPDFPSSSSSSARHSHSGLMASEELRLVRQRAGEFTLFLVKALNLTGTYTTDHQLARAALGDMYTLFRDLTAQAHELTYVLMSTVDEKGVMLEGLLPEPIEIGKVFRGVMGDHFVAKFHEYFLKNRIASFTIKHDIDRREFDTFIETWVRWSARVSEMGQAAGDLSEELTRLGVINVTVVRMDEILGAVRHLTWAVKIALSRLRKDISRLPMLRDASSDVIRQLKMQAIQDTVRPITRIETQRDLLLNADLATEGLTIATEDEVVEAILHALPSRSSVEVARQFLDMLDDLSRPVPQTNLAGREPRHFVQVVRQRAQRSLQYLSSSDLPEVGPLLETAYRAEIVAFEDLPTHLQRRIKAGQTAERFLQQWEAYLKDFDGCTDAKSYLKYLNVLLIVLPELVARKERQAVVGIFDVLTRHAAEPVPPFLGRTRFIQETISHLDTGSFLDGLIQIAATTPREERGSLEHGVALFGSSIVPGLVRFLAVSEDVSARKSVCTMLVHIGKDGVPFLVDELRAHRHQWYTVRNLVEVVSQIGDETAAPVIERYLGHPNPRVREECVVALARLMGYDGEKLLLPLLDDKDDTVVRRTVQALANIHSVNPGFLERLAEGVRLRARNESEPEDLVQVSCLRSLMEYERIVLPDEPDFETVLLEAVTPPRWRTLLPGRMGFRQKTQTVQQVVFETLGVLGRSRAREALMEVADSLEPPLRDYCMAAIARIQARLGTGNPA